MPAPLIDLARLKLRSDVPPRRQVAAYLKAIIGLGQVAPGDALPAPTALAGRIGAPTAEVKRAYGELEERGFVVAEGKTWRVSDDHLAVGNAATADEICERLWELVADARRAGFTRAELRRLFEQLLTRP